MPLNWSEAGMEIKFKVRAEDYWAGLIEGRFPTARLKNRYLIFHYGILPILFFYLFYHLSWHPAIPLSMFLLHALIFVLLWCFLGIPLVTELRDRLFMKRYVKSLVKEDSYLNEKRMVVKDDGVVIQATDDTLFIEWGKFLKVVENKTHFFFYYKVSGKRRKIGATILPKKELESETVQFLHERLSERVQVFIKKDTPPKMSSIPFFNRAILFVLIFILTGFNNLESYESYDKIKYDIYELWENVEPEEEPGELIEKRLLLKDTVTKEEVEKLNHRLHNKVEWTYNSPLLNLRGLSIILTHAEDQIMARAQEHVIRTFSGESQNWIVENYEVILYGDKYNETVEGTLTYKPEGMFRAKYFRVITKGIFNGQREVELHRYNLGEADSGEKVFEIKKTSTGETLTMDRGIKNANDERATIEDLTAVHIIIEWCDENDNFDWDQLEREVIILEPVSD